MSQDDQALSRNPSSERRSVLSAAMADAVPVLISYVDRDERYRFVNRAYENWFGVDRSEIEGKTLREVLGDDAYARVRQHVSRAMAGESLTFEGEVDYKGAGVRHIEARYVPDVAPTGEILGYYALITDISDRKTAEAEMARALAGERRRAVLLDLGQTLRDEPDPIAIAQIAARLLTAQLGVGRAGYGEMLPEPDMTEIIADDGDPRSGVGLLGGRRLRLGDFGASLSADMHAGHTVMVGDVALDPRTNDPDALEAYAAIGVRSFLTISLIKAGALSAFMFVAHDAPRAFSADDVAFVADVAELIWSASQRARSDQALARAAETERLLIREVDHRAKNVLAVVQSLAQLTPFESKAQYVQALSGRIGSLARAHSLLSTARWSGVDLRDLLRQELEPYDADGGERVVLEGPPVLIDAQAAQSMALVIHELATNASKYGALARPEGRLTVAWRWLDGQTLTLVWRETTGAPVAAPTRRGFGSTLIQSAVKQIGSRVAIDWRPEGLEASLFIQGGAHPRAADSTPPYRPGLAAEDVPALRDQRVLVVEDEALVAMELARVLTAAGAVVVGPVGTIAEAMDLVDAALIDRAVLDVNLGGQPVTPVARALSRRLIPFVYLTGYQDPDVDGGPVLRKPVATSALLGALARGAPLTARPAGAQ
ncbi:MULTISPECIES: HWE histidine kinase domain-containing protein [Caulobacter]|jgi:PAS domain S-box-containing protein|uniref:histidine kinase n=1 Tax=Caulobacter vibrioides OR37 TaxID=1292034 RepID=R0CVC0_CAUVI|nr:MULTISPECIES: HWE histidine kinase domain-containing protein [Caulobacter]ENZ80481.1 PAS domain S-box [Caulobacter vibrioides OR37]MBQ1559509.1 PAS domain-containing protein [Caulobacter sp.]